MHMEWWENKQQNKQDVKHSSHIEKRKRKSQSSLSSNSQRKTSPFRPHSFDRLVISGKCSAKSPQQRLLSNKDVANIKRKKRKTRQNNQKEISGLSLDLVCWNIITARLLYCTDVGRCLLWEMLVKKRRQVVKSRLSSQGNKKRRRDELNMLQLWGLPIVSTRAAEFVSFCYAAEMCLITMSMCPLNKNGIVGRNKWMEFNRWTSATSPLISLWLSLPCTACSK